MHQHQLKGLYEKSCRIRRKNKIKIYRHLLEFFNISRVEDITCVEEYSQISEDSDGIDHLEPFLEIPGPQRSNLPINLMIPQFMEDHNFKKVEYSARLTYLAVEILAHHPISLYCNGVMYEINSREEAKLLGRKIYQELEDLQSTLSQIMGVINRGNVLTSRKRPVVASGSEDESELIHSDVGHLFSSTSSFSGEAEEAEAALTITEQVLLNRIDSFGGDKEKETDDSDIARKLKRIKALQLNLILKNQTIAVDNISTVNSPSPSYSGIDHVLLQLSSSPESDRNHTISSQGSNRKARFGDDWRDTLGLTKTPVYTPWTYNFIRGTKTSPASHRYNNKATLSKIRSNGINSTLNKSSNSPKKHHLFNFWRRSLSEPLTDTNAPIDGSKRNPAYIGDTRENKENEWRSLIRDSSSDANDDMKEDLADTLSTSLSSVKASAEPTLLELDAHKEERINEQLDDLIEIANLKADVAQHVDNAGGDNLKFLLFEMILGEEFAHRAYSLMIDSGDQKSMKCKDFESTADRLFCERSLVVNRMFNQRKMLMAVQKMFNILFWIPIAVIVLIVIGMPIASTIIAISGITASLTVVLGTFHSTFMQSLMLVAFNNPFKIGDRLLLDGNRAIIVETELLHCVTADAEDIFSYIPYSVLNGMELKNDTSTTRAVFFEKFFVSDQTSTKKIQTLRSLCEAFVAIRPYYFVANGFYLRVSDHQPGHYLELEVYACYKGSWHYWMRVARSRTEFLFFVLRCCQVLRIQYSLPVQPLAFVGGSTQHIDTGTPELDWQQFMDDHVEYKPWNERNIVPRLNPDAPVTLDHPIYNNVFETSNTKIKNRNHPYMIHPTELKKTTPETCMANYQALNHKIDSIIDIIQRLDSGESGSGDGKSLIKQQFSDTSFFSDNPLPKFKYMGAAMTDISPLETSSYTNDENNSYGTMAHSASSGDASSRNLFSSPRDYEQITLKISDRGMCWPKQQAAFRMNHLTGPEKGSASIRREEYKQHEEIRRNYEAPTQATQFINSINDHPSYRGVISSRLYRSEKEAAEAKMEANCEEWVTVRDGAVTASTDGIVSLLRSTKRNV
eukprot:GHVH01007541.1.p1 GENE.GHVH01007541.1~~GHVH01007541.1.p1  ORF type:complete len:1075 (+),score=156.71 GHVH01007541.1:1114-4338(+)